MSCMRSQDTRISLVIVVSKYKYHERVASTVAGTKREKRRVGVLH